MFLFNQGPQLMPEGTHERRFLTIVRKLKQGMEDGRNNDVISHVCLRCGRRRGACNKPII